MNELIIDLFAGGGGGRRGGEHAARREDRSVNTMEGWKTWLPRAAAAASRRAPETPERRAARIAQERADAERAFGASTDAHLETCGLAPREREALSTGWAQDWIPARVAAAFWTAKDKRILLLGGVPGAGKTLAAAGLFLRLREGIRRADWDGAVQPRWATEAGRYVSAVDLNARDAFDARTERDLRALPRRALVVLDELGGEKARGAPWLASVERLVDDFYRSARGKLVLVTNLGVGAKGEFWNVYGAKVRRRIAETGTILQLDCATCARGVACDGHRLPIPISQHREGGKR